MYYLPNNLPVDVDSIIDGMLDDSVTTDYFLDSKMGDVVASEVAHPPSDKERYFKIPRIHETSKEKWMKEFIRVLVDSEDKRLAKKLRSIFAESKYRGVMKHFEEMGDESWLGVWDQWSGDCAFERLDAWFDTLPFPVEVRWHGDDDCAICRAVREGGDEDELLEAFVEQSRINAEKNSYTNQNKDIPSVESQLNTLITEFDLDEKLSVHTIREWVLNEEGDPLQANRDYFEKWSTLFGMDFDDPRFQSVMDAFTDAWNYFPHTSLGGKSPRQLFEEETEN
jgi:hypothetical protein